jgi:type IV secretion system protein TrbI
VSREANDVPINPVRPMNAPGGLDLRPKPPSTVRVSKRAGIAVSAVIAAILGLFAYGGYKRQIRQERVQAESGPKSVAPATAAGTEILKDIPAGGVVTAASSARTGAAELQPPADSREATTSAGARVVVGQPRPAPVQPQPSMVQRNEPTFEERLVMQAYQREQQAMLAPTSIGQQSSWSSVGNSQALGSSQGSVDDLARVAALGQALAARQQGPARDVSSVLSKLRPSAADGETGDQSSQTRKEAFLARARASAGKNYLESTRTPPVSEYEIKAGWEIPAVMEQALNSDLPGEVKALVTSNVYDTATGQHVLIPQGSRLIGIYDSHVDYGQDGVQVVWNRIIFPDASTLDLGGMSGQGSGGFSGFRHTVDRHYRRLIGFAVLTSLFSAGFQISQNRNRSVLTYPTPGEAAAAAVGREISQLGAQITRRNLNVQPTIKIPVGYKFNVRVNRDIAFEAPYEPMQAAH